MKLLKFGNNLLFFLNNFPDMVFVENWVKLFLDANSVVFKRRSLFIRILILFSLIDIKNWLQLLLNFMDFKNGDLEFTLLLVMIALELIDV